MTLSSFPLGNEFRAATWRDPAGVNWLLLQSYTSASQWETVTAIRGSDGQVFTKATTTASQNFDTLGINFPV